jgi:hypothetical protein
MSLYRTLIVAGICAGALSAQDVISAKSGLVHYFEGVVTLDGKNVERKSSADFPSMKEGSELRTGLGRAEVLLSPGVFLRISEQSGVRLDKSDLLDTRLALTGGSVLLEVSEAAKNQALTVTVGETKLDLSKRGLFRIDFSPASVRVLDGSAIIVAGGQTITVKEGRQAELTGAFAQAKFDKEETDAFYRWAQRRSGYIASANLAAAKRAYDRGSSMGFSNWMWNPYFGMFTFVPMNGMYRSPFGYRYYSPGAVANVYYRPVYTAPSNTGWNSPSIMDSGRGMGSMGGRGGNMGGYSGGGVTAAPPMSGSAPAPAAGGRGADGGGSRGGGGGR